MRFQFAKHEEFEKKNKSEINLVYLNATDSV